MNSISIIVFVACLAAANAGVALVQPSAKIIQGPSTRTTVIGPDGSSISSAAPGGTIIKEDAPGIVAETAPIVAAAHPITYAASPLAAPLTYAATPLAYSHTPIVSAYSVPVAAYSAGIVSQNHLDTVVAGPSGTIATSKTVNTPALVASAPHLYAAGLHTLYH